MQSLNISVAYIQLTIVLQSLSVYLETIWRMFVCQKEKNNSYHWKFHKSVISVWEDMLCMLAVVCQQ